MGLYFPDYDYEAIEDDLLRLGVYLFLLILLVHTHKDIPKDIDIVDEEFEGVLSLTECLQASNQLLTHWPTHLRLYHPHLLVDRIDTDFELLAPMPQLFWLEAAALDKAVGEGLKQAKVNLRSRRTLYKFIVLAQSLEGHCKLPQVVVDHSNLYALLKFLQHCGDLTCELAGEPTVPEPGEIDANLFLEHADQGRVT